METIMTNSPRFLLFGLLWCMLIVSTTSLSAAIAPLDRILPRPQQVNNDNWRNTPLNQGQITINIPDNAPEGVKIAQKILGDKLNEYATLNGSESTVIDLLWAEKDTLPEQGYQISVQDGRITVAGADLRGLFYGAMTLKQLARPGELPVTEITDYPVWTERYASDYFPVSYEGYLSLAERKFTGYAWQWRFREWRKLTPDGECDNASVGTMDNGLKSLKRAIDTGLFDALFNIHIYAESEKPFNTTNEEDIQELLGIIRYLADHGIKYIMIGSDDWVKRDSAGNYVCQYPEENAKFGNSIGRAMGYLLKRLHDDLKNDYPELKLALSPSIYSMDHRNAGAIAEEYMRDWAAEAPDEVAYVWTGAGIIPGPERPLNLEVTQKFQADLGNHPLLYWDNAEDTNNPIPAWESAPELGVEKFHNKVCFLNAHTYCWEEAKPFILTGNDALWNPTAYDPVRSYNSALILTWGDQVPVDAYRYFRELNRAYKSLPPALRDPRKIQILNEMKRCIAVMKQAGVSPYERCENWVKSQEENHKLKSTRMRFGRLRSPLVIDGTDSDPAWEKGFDFVLLPGSGPNGCKDEKVWSKIVRKDYGDTYLNGWGKLGYTPENIYLFLQMKNHGDWTPKAASNPPKDPEATTDYVRFELYAGGKTVKFSINAAGEVKCEPAELLDKIQYKITRPDERWLLELAIPTAALRELGFPQPTSKSVWYGVVERWIENWHMSNTSPAPFWGELQFE